MDNFASLCVFSPLCSSLARSDGAAQLCAGACPVARCAARPAARHPHLGPVPRQQNRGPRRETGRPQRPRKHAHDTPVSPPPALSPARSPPPPQPQSHPRRHPRRRTHPPPRRPPPTKYTPSLTPASSIDASLANLLPPSHASPPPQPLILDPSLRFPLTSRILNEWNTKPALRGRTLKQPWILCGSNVSSDRINEVQQAGARVVPVPLDSNGASNAKRGLTKTDLSFHDTMIDLFEQVASLHRPFLPS